MQANPEYLSAMDDVRDRIAYIIKEKHRNANAFGAATGISKQLIYDIIGRKRNMPSYQSLVEISSAIPDINVEWLMFGRGEPFTTGQAAEPTAPVALVRESGPVVPLKRPLLPRQSWKGQASVKLLPGVTASAGRGAITEAATSATTQVLVPGLPSSEGHGYLALTVEGDSMEPCLFEGDLLVIDQVFQPATAKPGKPYVFITSDGESFVKRLHSIRDETLHFVSDNPAYSMMKIHLKDLYQLFRVALKLTQNIGSLSEYIHDDKTQAIIGRLDALESRL